MIVFANLIYCYLVYVNLYFFLLFSEEIKYFPFFRVCILCIFYILFKKNSKKFYFCFFSAKLAAYVNNSPKNLYTKFCLFVCFTLTSGLLPS